MVNATWDGKGQLTLQLKTECWLFDTFAKFSIKSLANKSNAQKGSDGWVRAGQLETIVVQ